MYLIVVLTAILVLRGAVFPDFAGLLTDDHMGWGSACPPAGEGSPMPRESNNGDVTDSGRRSVYPDAHEWSYSMYPNWRKFFCT